MSRVRPGTGNGARGQNRQANKATELRDSTTAALRSLWSVRLLARLLVTSIVFCTSSLWANDAPGSSNAQPITIRDIRVGVTAERTRLVFDADGPVAYPPVKQLEAKRLVLELPGVVFRKIPAPNDFSHSAIANVDVAAQKGKPTIVTISLKSRAIISVTPYAPEGRDGHRLVMDFKKMTKVSRPAKTAAVPAPKPVVPRPSRRAGTDASALQGRQDTITLSADRRQQPTTITKFRLGVSEKRTRLVLDSDRRISYGSVGELQAQRLILELPNVAFQERPVRASFAGSAITDIEISAAERDRPAIVTIDLRRRATVRVTPYAPKGRYGHRLVIDFEETTQAARLSQSVALPTRAPFAPSRPEPKATDESFVRGQHAIAGGDYANALSIYQRLMSSGDAEVGRRALEYYAVALERSGKKARAKLEYQNYLSRYPNSEGVSRVQQRLNAMLSLERTNRPQLRTAKRAVTTRQGLESWGIFLEDYRWSQTVDTTGESNTRLSSIFALQDITSRFRGKNTDLQLRVSGGNERSYLDEDPDQASLSYLYLDGEHRSSGRSIRLGRQRQNSGGTVGRFDGVWLSSPISESTRMNIVAGYPVDRSTDTDVDNARSFYGINADFGPYYEGMDINLFYIQQSIDNVTDREAVGGQFECSSEHYFVSGYVDYDVHFSELNAAIINGRYRSEGGTHVSLAMNYRKSPYLTTRNALIGQQVDNITDLQEILGIDDPDQLDELALDRTFDSSLINLYINQPITKEIDINTTITVSELSDTPASAGVPAFEGTGVEYYISTQLVARDLFSERDSGYLGLTYASRTGSDVYSISSYYRYQLNSNWRLYPRLTVQQRDNDNGTGQTRYSLQLRSEYKFNKKHRIDGRLSGDWYRNSTRFGEHKFATYFFNLGYTYSF